jgi:hypothetical protein
MSLDKVMEIEQAIGTLTPEELGELYAWLDTNPSPLDRRVASDLSSGALDEAIGQALADEQSGRVQLLK